MYVHNAGHNAKVFIDSSYISITQTNLYDPKHNVSLSLVIRSRW